VRDRPNGVHPLDGLLPAAGRLDGLAPARRDEARREIRKRRQDEQPLPGEPMRNDEVRRSRWIRRAGFRRSLDVDPMSAEDEQVEVQLARTPALALAPPERALQPLERDEQGQRAGRGIGPARDVDRDGRVAELRLVDPTDGCRRVEPRDAAEPGTRQGGEGPDPRGDRLGRVADVRSEPDVSPNSPGQCPPS
jgi:hypothetical protein